MSKKWPNSFATKCITKMYLQSDSADIHFIFPCMELAPPEKVPAHKALLASASSVFNAMFYGPLKEGDTVKITDSNASTFKKLLQFIYLPEVTLTNDDIEEVVRLADKYDMLECFETYAEFLEANLTTENMLWGYELAIALNNAQLKKFCEKRIQIFCDEVIKSKVFLQCSRDVIDHMLKLDPLDCDEVELFNACIEWAKASCQKNDWDENNSENLKNQLGDCFYSIRFGVMDGKEIGQILLNKVVYGMFTKDDLADIMQSKWTKPYESVLFSHQPRLKPIYAWNAANKLICKRIILTNEPQYMIRQQESTWFSTNELVWLGELVFDPVKIYFEGLCVNSMHFDIKIIEHGEDNFGTDAPTKQLYANIIGRGSTLVLKTPIIIRPKKMYEIRLHLRSGVGDYSHFSSWENQEVKLNDKITIKFHQNPTENNSARHCLVPTMYFNQFE